MQKISNFIKLNQGKASVLIAVIFLITLCIYQKPYYFVFYDSEPDYLGNALHIVNWGFPIGAHHPATVTYYFLALIIKLIPAHSLTVATEILVLRLSLFSVCCFCIYSGCKLLYNGKEVVNTFILAISFAFLMPPINYFVDLICGETILYGLGFLVIAHIYKYVNGGLNRNYLLPILLGVSLSVKLSSISFVIIVLLCHLQHILFLLGQSQTKAQVYEKVKSFLAFYFIVLVSFLTLSIPVILFVKDSFQNLISRASDDFGYRSILAFFGLLIVSGAILFRFRSKIHSGYTTSNFLIMLSRFLLGLSVIVWIVYLIKVYLTTDSLIYTSFAIATRHLNPLLALIFVPGIFGKFRISLTPSKKSLALLLIILSALTVKMLMNQSYISYAEEKESGFKKMVSAVAKNADHVMVYPSSEFASKEMFEMWTTYRYGNGMIDFKNTFQTDSFTNESGVKKITYLAITENRLKENIVVNTDQKTNSVKTAPESHSAELPSEQAKVSVKRKWYQKLSKKDLKDFYISKLEASYMPGKFLFRNLTGFTQISSVYHYMLPENMVHVPDSMLTVGVIVPAFNIDYLYEEKPKGHYFVARTPEVNKKSYLDSLRSKLLRSNITFKETTLSQDNVPGFLSFQIYPANK